MLDLCTVCKLVTLENTMEIPESTMETSESTMETSESTMETSDCTMAKGYTMPQRIFPMT